MAANDGTKALRVALAAIGFVFVFGVYPMMKVWPAGWVWEPSQAEYEWMILGIYATLGVFLIAAARDPLEHRSLIWFTVWSSVVHGGIMLVEALVDPAERGHLLGDVPALFLVAAVLGVLMRRATVRGRERAAPPERRAPSGAEQAPA